MSNVYIIPNIIGSYPFMLDSLIQWTECSHCYNNTNKFLQKTLTYLSQLFEKFKDVNKN